MREAFDDLAPPPLLGLTSEDVLTDLPIEVQQFPVDGERRPLLGGMDPTLEVCKPVGVPVGRLDESGHLADHGAPPFRSTTIESTCSRSTRTGWAIGPVSAAQSWLDLRHAEDWADRRLVFAQGSAGRLLGDRAGFALLRRLSQAWDRHQSRIITGTACSYCSDVIGTVSGPQSDGASSGSSAGSSRECATASGATPGPHRRSPKAPANDETARTPPRGQAGQPIPSRTRSTETPHGDKPIELVTLHDEDVRDGQMPVAAFMTTLHALTAGPPGDQAAAQTDPSVDPHLPAVRPTERADWTAWWDKQPLAKEAKRAIQILNPSGEIRMPRPPQRRGVGKPTTVLNIAVAC